MSRDILSDDERREYKEGRMIGYRRAATVLAECVSSVEVETLDAMAAEVSRDMARDDSGSCELMGERDAYQHAIRAIVFNKTGGHGAAAWARAHATVCELRPG